MFKLRMALAGAAAGLVVGACLEVMDATISHSTVDAVTGAVVRAMPVADEQPSPFVQPEKPKDEQPQHTGTWKIVSTTDEGDITLMVNISSISAKAYEHENTEYVRIGGVMLFLQKDPKKPEDKFEAVLPPFSVSIDADECVKGQRGTIITVYPDLSYTSERWDSAAGKTLRDAQGKYLCDWVLERVKSAGGSGGASA